MKRYLIGTMALLLVFLCVLGMASASTLVFPSVLKSIDEEAFYGNSSIDEVELPDGLTSIGDRAFAWSSLTRVKIPASVKKIGANAFDSMNPVEIDAPKGSYAYKWAVANNYISTDIMPETISLPEASISISVKGTYTYAAVIKPANATNKTIKWTSSNTKIATVSDGTVQAIQPGTVTITAETVNGIKAVSTVSILSNDSITITELLSLARNSEKYQIESTGTWTAKCEASWVNLSRTSGKSGDILEVSFTANKTKYTRLATIEVKSGTDTEILNINQGPLPVPGKPVISIGEVSAETIFVQWSDVPYAMGYNIYLAEGWNADNFHRPSTKLLQTSNNYAVIDSLTPGECYYVWVTAFNDAGETVEKEYQDYGLQVEMKEYDVPDKVYLKAVTFDGSTMNVSWNKVNYAQKYFVRLEWADHHCIYSNTVEGESIEITSLIDDMTYYVNVCGISYDGSGDAHYGEYSDLKKIAKPSHNPMINQNLPRFLSQPSVEGGLYDGDVYTIKCSVNSAVQSIGICYLQDGKTVVKEKVNSKSKKVSITGNTWEIQYSFQHVGAIKDENRTVILRCYDDEGYYEQVESKAFVCAIKQSYLIDNIQEQVATSGKFEHTGASVVLGSKLQIEGEVSVNNATFSLVKVVVDSHPETESKSFMAHEFPTGATSLSLKDFTEFTIDTTKAPFNKVGEYNVKVHAYTEDGTWYEVITEPMKISVLSPINVKSSGSGLKRTITIDSYDKWKATNIPNWISLSASSGVKGTTTITATLSDDNVDRSASISFSCNGYSKTIKITQAKRILIETITITPDATTLSVGQSTQLKVSITPQNASNKTLKWTVKRKTLDGYASVTNNGVVTGLSIGSVLVIAESTDGSGQSAVVSVEIKPTKKQLEDQYRKWWNENVLDLYDYYWSNASLDSRKSSVSPSIYSKIAELCDIIIMEEAYQPGLDKNNASVVLADAMRNECDRLAAILNTNSSYSSNIANWQNDIVKLEKENEIMWGGVNIAYKTIKMAWDTAAFLDSSSTEGSKDGEKDGSFNMKLLFIPVDNLYDVFKEEYDEYSDMRHAIYMTRAYIDIYAQSLGEACDIYIQYLNTTISKGPLATVYASNKSVYNEVQKEYIEAFTSLKNKSYTERRQLAANALLKGTGFSLAEIDSLYQKYCVDSAANVIFNGENFKKYGIKVAADYIEELLKKVLEEVLGDGTISNSKPLREAVLATAKDMAVDVINGDTDACHDHAIKGIKEVLKASGKTIEAEGIFIRMMSSAYRIGMPGLALNPLKLTDDQKSILDKGSKWAFKAVGLMEKAVDLVKDMAGLFMDIIDLGHMKIGYELYHSYGLFLVEMRQMRGELTIENLGDHTKRSVYELERLRQSLMTVLNMDESMLLTYKAHYDIYYKNSGNRDKAFIHYKFENGKRTKQEYEWMTSDNYLSSMNIVRGFKTKINSVPEEFLFIVNEAAK